MAINVLSMAQHASQHGPQELNLALRRARPDNFTEKTQVRPEIWCFAVPIWTTICPESAKMATDITNMTTQTVQHGTQNLQRGPFDFP